LNTSEVAAESDPPKLSLHVNFVVILLFYDKYMMKVALRMTTLLPIFVHSALISGPIDSKPSANER
jgi:hypothetical protein